MPPKATPKQTPKTNAKPTTTKKPAGKKLPSNAAKVVPKSGTRADDAKKQLEPAKPAWGPRDDAALKIQCIVRQFLSRRKLNQMKTQKLDYEAEMEKLEREAFVAIVKMEQEKLRKEQEKEMEERRKKAEHNKRIKRMLEAAYDGNIQAIKSILREVDSVDDENGIGKDDYGMYLRKRHQLGMVDCTDANDNTPLSEAASGGHQETIQLLLERGADVNSRGQFQRTPLYRAAFAGNMAAAQILLQNGADPRLYASDGLVPLFVAGSEQMKELLSEWDTDLTDNLLRQMEAEKDRRKADDSNLKQKQESRLEDEVSKAKSRYQTLQKQLEKALCELNKRIYEHDRCVLKGMSDKTALTLQAIEDAQATADSAQLEADRARGVWDEAKVRLLEQRKLHREGDGEEGDTEELVGEKITVRELTDVLLRDVGGRISANPKWPLIIDVKGQASTFLRYRDTNYVNALSMAEMEPEPLRMALLGAIRFGKPFVIDMMIVDMLESVKSRFSEIHKDLPELLIGKQITANENFKILLRDSDPKEYKLSQFYDGRHANFKFFLLTRIVSPSESLLDQFYPMRIHVPGADAFADVD